MDTRIKKLLCVLVCVVLILASSPVRAGAITLTAVNNTILPLSDSTMPARLGGELYVPYKVFSRLGVRAYIDESELHLSSGSEYLNFSTSEGYVYDQDQNSYTSPAYERNNTVYVPVKLCCGKFGLGYSTFSVAGETVLRITDSSAESDLDFTKSNTGVIEDTINAYNGNSGNSQSPSGNTGNSPKPVSPYNSGSSGNIDNSGTSGSKPSSSNTGASQKPGTSSSSGGANSSSFPSSPVSNPSKTSPSQNSATPGKTPSSSNGSDIHSGSVPPNIEEAPAKKPVKVYLAFYGAPNANTYGILNSLKASGCRAAFFLPTDASDTWNEDAVRRIAAEGHTLGLLIDTAKVAETEALISGLSAANERLSLITGLSVRIISFTEESGNLNIKRKKLETAGFRIWDYTLNAGDENASAEMAYATTVGNFAATDSTIVLRLHHGESTAKAVENLCSYMLKHGISIGLMSFSAEPVG